MENTNWLKQTNEPLFPDLLWSRPENKSQAGKLLIVGGNLHGFTAPARAYAAAEKAGIGVVEVIMPDKLQKTVSRLFPEAEFAPSTPSGSFSRQALAELIDRTSWADGVLLAGDFGKNSETAVLLESLVSKTTLPMLLSGDGLDYFFESPYNPLARKNTAVAADFSRLQSLAKHKRPETALTHSMSLYELVMALSVWSQASEATTVTEHAGQVVISYKGMVSATPFEITNLAELSAFLSVWQTQNPANPFEALTTGIFEYQKTQAKHVPPLVNGG